MKKLLSIVFTIIFTLNMLFVTAFATDEAKTPNLTAAKKAYNTTAVIYNESVETLQDDLFEAALNRSSDTKPCIVYIPAGAEYIIPEAKVHNKETIRAGYTAGIYVPENVVLVAEDDSKITAGADMQRLVMISGSVYGGKYRGAYKASFVLQFKNATTFGKEKSGKKQVDGNIEYTDVAGANSCCIKAIGCKNINIRYNYVHHSTKRNTSGISIMYGSYANEISDNKIKNVGSENYGSGIDITHASAKNIRYNTIYNVGGHGISTDTDQSPKSKTKQNYVKIKNISYNKITKTGAHGVWLEKRCQVTGVFGNNTIKNAGSCGIAIEGTHKYSGDIKYSVNIFRYNTISGSKRSNISLTGKYGKLKLGNKNTLNGSVEQCSVVLDNNAKLYIFGTGNQIKSNNQYGIYLKNGSYFKSEKKNTYIQKNGKYAIGLYNKSTAIVKNATLTNNTKGSAYVGKGSTLKISKCKCDKIVYGSSI